MSKIGERAPFGPFSCAAQAHIRVSVQGGAKQKRVPFSRPGEAGTMAMTTGGRRPAPLVAGLLDACLVSEAARNVDVHQAAAGPGILPVAPSGAAKPCPARCTGTSDPEIPKEKNERMGEHEQNENGQTGCVIAAFAGNDAFSAADDGVRQYGGYRRNQ